MLKLAVHKMVDPTGYAPVSQQCQCGVLLMHQGSVIVLSRLDTCAKISSNLLREFSLMFWLIVYYPSHWYEGSVCLCA